VPLFSRLFAALDSPGHEALGLAVQQKAEVQGSILAGKAIDIRLINPSPCSRECPLGTNVKGYVSLIAAGRFAEALALVRLTNPFPGVCGRVCPHPCEAACLRSDVEEPVSIAGLKRFLADYELRRGIIPRLAGPSSEAGGGPRVAIVGAGPAGLTCASDLAREGYTVRIFEALPVAGGMLAVGIPAYRLPKDILSIEIEAIKAQGVEIALNTPVGRSTSLSILAAEHEAVFLATGAQALRRLGIPGERQVRQGLISWADLLIEVSLGRGETAGAIAGQTLVVVGGGNTAVDAARAALRAGARKVMILYRRLREQMPAFPEEVAAAEEEGVELQFLCSPVRLISEKGKLTGVECVRMKLGEEDRSGRPAPVALANSEFVIPCDGIIPAVGQELDPSLLEGRSDIRLTESNLIQADPQTMATSQTGVFAGGDAVTGPASVVEAIAAGHRAAVSIHRFLTGASPAGALSAACEMTIDLPTASRKARLRQARLPASERRSSFEEIEQVFTPAQAVAEAERCLRCGPCWECATCVGVCDQKQVMLIPAGPTAGHPGASAPRLLRVTSELHGVLAAGSSAPASCQGEAYEGSTFTVSADERLCRGCGLCEELCAYHAVRVTYRNEGFFSAVVDADACRGCGCCVSVCPTGAMEQGYFTTPHLAGQIRSGGIVVFACHWNPALRSASGSLPDGIVRVMCAGRISAGQLLKAFEQDAKGVLVLGCSEQDCHYGFGHRQAEANLKKMAELMELLGLERERLGMISAGAQGEAQAGEFRRRIEMLESRGGKR
jgi:NADPH-dependent glutamate synthase beta subunit-like oxidoreductase/coenzyme F420-reducing hydrogenase delta subunit/Pyruvate/2-oxoacid:ferredoxin oxidoreductase delta subunit